jgi:hypothetical protein
MIGLLWEAMVVVACGLLLVLAVEVIGAMRRGRSWGAFFVWMALAVGALAVAAQWRQMPPAVAVLLLTLAVMLWRQRRRIVWAAEQGVPW